MELNWKDINELLLLKNPFCFVDHVSDFEVQKHAYGYRNVTWNDWFFKVHYPDDPCMPGNLIAEAMGQMLGFTVLALPENKGKAALLVNTDGFRLFRKVRPGDKLILKADVLSYRRGLLRGHCEAWVGDNKIAQAEITLMIEGSMVIAPQQT
jgi:3-hydroxyacyl-[acyl-carrier-protein] dehydratase